MSKGLKITLGIIGALLLILVVSAGSLWSHRQTAVSLEEQIKAKHTANKTSYDEMWKSFQEMTQVTELQAEQFKDVYQGLIEGRNKDQNLLFKMVKESNPQLSPEVYTKLQNQISAGRKGFKRDQQQLVDIIREYNTYIRHKPIMAMITHRVEIDPNDYVVTSNKTEKAFEDGKDDVIKLKGE